MKLWEKISLGFIFVVIAGIVTFCIWQSDNIRTIVMVLTKSSDQIATEMDENKKRLEAELQQKHPTVISDFTAEEEKKILKGEISVDEAMEIISQRYEEKKKALEGVAEENHGGETATENQQENLQTNFSGNGDYKGKYNYNGGTDKKNISNVDLIVGDKIVQLYSLKAFYLGQLGQLEAQVKREYISLPKEQRGVIGKKNLADRYMGVALGHMERCDSEVENLLNELRSDLEKANADTSIIGTIRAAYENEKAMKKAYYIKLIEE